MIGIAGAIGATVGLWVVARWIGKGRPCPTLVASLFDNPIVGRFSGVKTLLERADIRSGMRVLDAGCGPGRLTIPIAIRIGETGEVVALDIQDGMLDRVRRNAHHASVSNVTTMLGALEGNAYALLGEREAFDRIVLVTVLGEIPDGVGALRALHAALKPEGILSVTETIIDPDYISDRRLKRLAEDAGFVLREQFGSPLAFTLNFCKVGWERAVRASRQANGSTH